MSPDTRQRITDLVESDPVLLFMKGSPEAPQCGFSAQVVQILGRLVPGFGSFDVLSDPEVRDGIKDFSDWPTIPQLYIKGEFVGGCDIIREMYANGELHTALGLSAPAVAAPELSITDAAAEVLRGASEQNAGAEIHLAIDAGFQGSLGFGPPQPDELVVQAGDMTLHMDRDTAARANGVTIDAVDTADGKRLTIDNPNAPR